MRKMRNAVVIFMIICLSFCFCTSVYATNPLARDNNPDVQDENIQDDNIDATSDEPTPIDEGLESPDISDGETDHIHDTDEIHEGDLYIFDNDYVMDKLVDGNVFIFGNNVKITGSVNGSLFVCASKVEIDKDAYIACHLVVMGEEVVMNGMALDMYAAGGTLRFENDTLIYRQIKLAGDKIHFAGTVGRDVSLYGDNITINEEALNVYGDFEYESGSKIQNIDEFVQGEVKFKEAREYEESIGSKILNYVFSAIGTILFDVLIYFALIYFAPKFVKKSKEYVSTKGLLAFVIGFAFIFVVPILVLLLCMTGVLSGIGLLAIALYFTLLMINALVVATIANEFITDKFKIEDKFKKIMMIIPVSLVLWGIRQVPYIGTLISAVVCLYGIGVVILYQFRRERKD